MYFSNTDLSDKYKNLLKLLISIERVFYKIFEMHCSATDFSGNYTKSLETKTVLLRDVIQDVKLGTSI